MKFIFPQNYDFKNKLFGFLDYSTLFLNLLWDILIFIILYFIPFSISIKIFIFIILCFPLILLSFSGFNGENVVYVMFYILKFQFKQKLFLYGKNKNCNNYWFK